MPSKRAWIQEESTCIGPFSLPIAIAGPDGSVAPAAPRAQIPTEGLSLEDNERMLLARALKKNRREPDPGCPPAAHDSRHPAV
ncbi:MAG: hypothetical protein ABSH32_09175 [Bryobacteraceae bacterium]|jgi:hypothetical protein